MSERTETLLEILKRPLSEGLRAKYCNIPWKSMAGVRDRLIHHYFGVNLDIVWQIVTVELPSIAPSKSDHNHLGKIITYSVAMNAKIAIWIVAEPRPEHVNAITWLNESGASSFYLLKIEAIRIGDSPSAPLFQEENYDWWIPRRRKVA